MSDGKEPKYIGCEQLYRYNYRKRAAPGGMFSEAALETRRDETTDCKKMQIGIKYDTHDG